MTAALFLYALVDVDVKPFNQKDISGDASVLRWYGDASVLRWFGDALSCAGMVTCQCCAGLVTL